MSRYRFVLRPTWILSHLFVLVMMAAMVVAGFWQLDRLDQRREANAAILERAAEPVVDVQDLDPMDAADVSRSLEYRRVTATGTYLPDDEVLAGKPSRGGDPGSWILTPMRLEDGTLVAVNRGWIPNGGRFDEVPDQFRAPEGEVTVTGLIRKSETRGFVGSTDPTGSTLAELARIDVVRLDAEVDGDVLPFYLQLEVQDPAVRDTDPQPMDPPELGEGPHLSYAIQWFTFTILTAIVYALILRKKRNDLERGPIEDLDGEPDDVVHELPSEPTEVGAS